MAQIDGDRLNFREVDQDGNPAGDGAVGQADSASESTRTASFTINPFIVALWLASAGLIVAGFGMFLGAQNAAMAGPNSSDSMPLNYLWMSFAPNVLLAGVLTSAGLLFWHAAQWQRHAK
ncbi:hypothetical protein V3C33_20450 [Micrococcaceae bacterium Sec5.7]